MSTFVALHGKVTSLKLLLMDYRDAEGMTLEREDILIQLNSVVAQINLLIDDLSGENYAREQSEDAGLAAIGVDPRDE